MKFLIVHNRYSRSGGEEGVVAFQQRLLQSRGHSVILYERSYDEIGEWKLGRLKSLFTSLRNLQAVREIRELVRREQPDAAIVHNLFPVISPAIIPALRRAGVPVLMTLHNYRLICPIGTFYTRGEICERCGTSAFRELNCLLRRCEGTLAGSAAYALRNSWARGRGYYLRYVNAFLALTSFQQQKLAHYGVPLQHIRLLPNCLDPAAMPVAPATGTREGYVGYAGRLSPEKGIDLLFETARLMPDRLFKIAGVAAEGWRPDDLPPNVELLGLLGKEELARFYSRSGAVVTTSKWYEGFPLSLLEAMYYGAPVAVPDLGGLPEIVGEAGAVYRAGSAESLREKLSGILGNNALGEAGRERVLTLYNPDTYYRLLMESLPSGGR